MASYSKAASRRIAVCVPGIWLLLVVVGIPLADARFQSETIADLESRVSALPDNAGAHHGLGLALARDHQYARAIEELSTAIRIAPTDLAPYLDLAAVFDETNLADEAEDLLGQTASAFPRSLDARLLLAERLFRSGKIERALESFREASRLLDPDVALALHVLVARRIGDMHVHLLEFDHALVSYDRARSLDPNHPDVHMALGLLYLRRNLLDDASESYAHVARIAPGNPDAQHGIAESMLRAGRFQDAADAAHRALALDGDHLGASYVLAMALVRNPLAANAARDAALDRYRALEARARSADQREREIGGIYKEAIAMSLEGDGEGAVRTLEDGIVRFPDARELRLNLGSILMSVGREADALEVFREMHARGWGDDPVVRRAIGESPQRAGNP